jgi:hypothetical protein
MIGPPIEGFRVAERVTVAEATSRYRGKTGYITMIVEGARGGYWFQVDLGKHKPWFRSGQLEKTEEGGDGRDDDTGSAAHRRGA